MSQKQSLNLVVFDDDENTCNQQQMRKYSEKKISINNHEKDKSEVILREISQLQQQICSIEKQSEQLKHHISQSHAQGINQGKGSNNVSFKEVEEILSLVEKKLQFVMKETKSIFENMEKSFTRKINALPAIPQKISEINVRSGGSQSKESVEEIRRVFQEKVELCERHYQSEYQRLAQATKQKQSALLQRLSEAEQKFMNRMNQWEGKEQEYVNWIHHLEAKLKEHKKSKKMITITQEKPLVVSNAKPGNSHARSSQNIQQHNSSNVENTIPMGSRVNTSVDQRENSKVVRKRKIFGDKSTSPVPKAKRVSPTRDAEGRSNIAGSIEPSLSINQGQSVMRSQQNLGFYNEFKKGPQHQSQSRAPVQNEFYKDIPKPNSGWDNFADMNDDNHESYTDSQSDYFFAPIDNSNPRTTDRFLNNIPIESNSTTQYGEEGFSGRQFKVQVPPSQPFSESRSQDKVFSPFDLN